VGGAVRNHHHHQQQQHQQQQVLLGVALGCAADAVVMAAALASQDPFLMPAKAWFKDPVEHAFKMRESQAGRHAADASSLCEPTALRNAYAQWLAVGPEREQRTAVERRLALHWQRMRAWDALTVEVTPLTAPAPSVRQLSLIPPLLAVWRG
jgi:hypothetical protein